jgi:2-phosphoglycerate kinase
MSDAAPPPTDNPARDKFAYPSASKTATRVVTDPETIVVHKGHGLPYSKGLMAQSLSATGLAPERAFELARVVERRLGERGDGQIDIAGLHALCEEVLLAEQGEPAVRRYRDWRRLDRLDRPLVVMIGGTTGVGKSTLAAMLAARVGVNRVIATDVIRQVLRAFFSHEFMPAVHHSAFEADDATDESGLAGYRRQAQHVGMGVGAILERAASEGTPLIVEGVHVVPGALDGAVRERCVVVEALLMVADEELHRGHFSHRGGARPAERYLRRFDEIRRLQDELVALAGSAEVPVIENHSADEALAQLMELVLDAVGTA